MNIKLIKIALEEYVRLHLGTDGNSGWHAFKMKKLLVKIDTPVSAGVLSKEGGEWLGAVRRWIQYKFVNGDQVTWGSTEQLKANLTVSDLEQLASEVAASAINEFIGLK